MGLYAVLGISRPRNYKKRSEKQSSVQVPVGDVSLNPTPGFKASIYIKRVKSNAVRLMSKNRFNEAMTICGREIILSPRSKFSPIPFGTLPVFTSLSYSRTNIFKKTLAKVSDYPWGNSRIKVTGILVGKFKLNP